MYINLKKARRALWFAYLNLKSEDYTMGYSYQSKHSLPEPHFTLYVHTTRLASDQEHAENWVRQPYFIY